MDETTLATVRRFEERLAKVMADAAKIKHHINGLFELEGEPPKYPSDEIATGTAPPVRSSQIRADQFFGRPVATVVKEILIPRQDKEGAILLDELFAILAKGGFELEGKDEQTKKRILASIIGRNPAFVKVPQSGAIGLADWYPTAKRGRPPKVTPNGASEDQAELDDAPGEVISPAKTGEEKLI